MKNTCVCCGVEIPEGVQVCVNCKSKKGLTVYEAIKTMSIEEMTSMLYIIMKPMFEALKLDDELKKSARKMLLDTLNSKI